MKRKSFTIGIVIVILAGIGTWWFLRPASPSGTSTISISNLDLEISVSYSRPYKKGRVIFGDASTGALQPYGQYWRLGANAATQITFNRDVSFGGQPVPAGTYRMYAIPGAQTWRIVLNSALGKSGSELPDNNLDVVTVEVPPGEAASPLEQFSIALKSEASGAVMELKWDRAVLFIKIS